MLLSAKDAAQAVQDAQALNAFFDQCQLAGPGRNRLLEALETIKAEANQGCREAIFEGYGSAVDFDGLLRAFTALGYKTAHPGGNYVERSVKVSW